MLVKSEAIVLHAFKYGETRLIVDVFTRQSGRLSFITSMPKTAKGRLKKQYFQPLTLLEVEYDHHPKVQLQKMRDARLLSPYVSIPFEPTKLSIALFIAEFLYHALKGEQQNAPLFDYVRYSVEWLDGCTAAAANFHLVFLIHMSRFLGFYPNIEERGTRSEERGTRSEERGTRNEEGGTRREERFFDLREGRFCATAPLHRDFLVPEDASKMAVLMRMDYPTMHLFRMSHDDRRRLLDTAVLYYRLHLPDFPELKSLAVLEEMYR